MKKLLLPIMLLLLIAIASAEYLSPSSEESCEGNYCTITSYTGPVAYNNGSGLVPINTTIQVYGQDGYDYAMTTADYNVYFKSNSNWGDAVKYCVEDQCLIYQPQDLSYRDVYGSQDYISSVINAQASVNGNSWNYNGLFPGTNISFSLYNTMMKERYIIGTPLEEPAGYLTPPITLDFGGYIKYGELHLYVDGQEVTGTNFVTSSKIEFKNDQGTTIFYLPKPYAHDANGNITNNVSYEVKKNGNSIWFYTRTPYDWLQEAAYPVTIDPSVTTYVGAYTDNVIGRTDTSSWESMRNHTVGEDLLPSNTELGFYMIDYAASSVKILRRAFYIFDTSALPSSATITDAELCVSYFITSWTAGSSPYDYFALVNFTPANKSLVVLEDYDQFERALIADKVFSANVSGVDDQICMSLYAGGIASIDVDGATALGLMLGWDFDEVDVPDGSSGAAYLYAEEVAILNTSLVPKLIITYTEAVPPSYENNTINDSTPKYGDSVKWSIDLTDDDSLDYYVFANNMSGTMTNGTLTNISGSSYSINESLVVNVTRGTYVCGQFWFNDTSGNSVTSNNTCFTVENTIPTVTANITPSIAPSTTNLTGYSTFYDVDGDTNTLNETSWYLNGVSVSSAINETVFTSGNTSVDDEVIFSIRSYDGYNWSEWVNSSIIEISDSSNPSITNINTSLGTSFYTDELQNVSVNCTDTESPIDYVYMELYTGGSYVNVSMVASRDTYYRSQLYSIGTHNVTNFYCADTSGNINKTSSSLVFNVTTRPSASGGGGGDKVLVEYVRISNLTDYCGDGVCQDGENPNTCWDDCRINYDTLLTCIWDEEIECNWGQTWFPVALVVFILIMALISIYLRGNNG